MKISVTTNGLLVTNFESSADSNYGMTYVKESIENIGNYFASFYNKSNNKTFIVRDLTAKELAKLVEEFEYDGLFPAFQFEGSFKEVDKSQFLMDLDLINS